MCILVEFPLDDECVEDSPSSGHRECGGTQTCRTNPTHLSLSGCSSQRGNHQNTYITKSTWVHYGMLGPTVDPL